MYIINLYLNIYSSLMILPFSFLSSCIIDNTLSLVSITSMRKYGFIVLLSILFITSQSAIAQSLDQLEASRVRLPNGWSLTTVGRQLPLGDLPLNIAVSMSGKLIAVTNNGQSDQSIYLFDATEEKLLDTAVVGKAWYGLAFTADERTLFASGGNDNWIIRYDCSNRKLIPHDTIILGKPWPHKISPAGLAYDDERHILYVVTKDNNSLYCIDTETKSIVKRVDLGGEGYACLLAPDKKTLYVSCWGCEKVIMFDTQKQDIIKSVFVGSHPNELCIDKTGTVLFVANANDNSVSVIDLRRNEVIEILNSALYPNAPVGSTANSLSLNGEGNTLYIANADNNCLAVFDVSVPGRSKSKGFIPTGWYPTSVRVIGGKIFVANGKGYSSFPNPYGPNPARKKEKVVYQKGDLKKEQKVQYIGGMFRGT